MPTSRTTLGHRHHLTWSAVALLASAGSAVAAVGVLQPPWVARLLARQSAVVVAVPTRTRAVALTVDDGPHRDLTPLVLDTLRRHGARATFFFLGSGVARHPDIARRAVLDGHEVGNHGWADRPAVRMPLRAFVADVRRTAREITSATGREPTVFRPGSGWFRPSHLRHLRAEGTSLVLGSVAVVDLRVRDVDAELAFVVDRLQPGAVVVLHEGRSDRAAVVDLLDRLLPEIARLGYGTLTVSELLATRP